MNQRYLLLLFFLIIPISLRAQVKFSVSYYHDINGDKATNYHPDNLAFTPIDATHTLNALDNRGAYLFKVTIHQPIPADGLIISLWNEHLDTVALYRQQGNALAFISYAGNHFYTPQSAFGGPTFELEGAGTQYYFKLSFSKNAALPIHVYTQAGYSRFNQVLLFQLGLYHGIVIIVLLINLLLYFIFKEKRFIYYNCFLFFLVLSFLFSNSHFALFTYSPFWLNNADMFLHLGLVISGALFASTFLEIAGVYPWLKWTIGGLITVIVVAFSINIFHPGFIIFLTGEIAVFASFTVYWVISLLRIKKHPFAKYFALAYGVLLFFTVNVYLLHQFGIFCFDIFTGQLEVANIIEMFILSTALAFSVDKLYRQNLHYRVEIDRYMHKEMNQQNQTAGKAAEVFSDVQLKYNLTERETEVLKGITEGLTNQEIGEKLFLSVNTIKFHTRNIFEKMEISNRAQAVSRLHEAK
jgi:DNA-binding CsgD family transcriptional regulator